MTLAQLLRRVRRWAGLASLQDTLADLAGTGQLLSVAVAFRADSYLATVEAVLADGVLLQVYGNHGDEAPAAQGSLLVPLRELEVVNVAPRLSQTLEADWLDGDDPEAGDDPQPIEVE